jgi:hypothetical protein
LDDKFEISIDLHQKGLKHLHPIGEIAVSANVEAPRRGLGAARR